MKRKLLEFGGATVVLLGILGILYLVLGRIGNGPPEVGSVTIRCGAIRYPSLEMRSTGPRMERRGERGGWFLKKSEKRPLSLPTTTISQPSMKGIRENGSFYFTIYTDEFKDTRRKRSWFTLLWRSRGNYLVCILKPIGGDGKKQYRYGILFLAPRWSEQGKRRSCMAFCTSASAHRIQSFGRCMPDRKASGPHSGNGSKRRSYHGPWLYVRCDRFYKAAKSGASSRSSAAGLCGKAHQV